jgi:hypothetical protein
MIGTNVMYVCTPTEKTTKNNNLDLCPAVVVDYNDQTYKASLRILFSTGIEHRENVGCAYNTPENFNCL